MNEIKFETQGERLKYIRKQHKKTQQQMGEALHLSRDHISRLERNQCNPTASTIDLFCRLFGVNKEWILTGNGRMDSDLSTLENHYEFKELADKIIKLPQDKYDKVMTLLKIYLEDE